MRCLLWFTAGGGGMLTVETIGRIRREHFLNGKTIKEIARDLKVSRNTVRKVLRSGETSFEYERDVQPRPKLGRWTEEGHIKADVGALITKQQTGHGLRELGLPDPGRTR